MTFFALLVGGRVFHGLQNCSGMVIVTVVIVGVFGAPIGGGGIVFRNCKYCGEEFFAPPGNYKYCSDCCREDHHRDYMREWMRRRRASTNHFTYKVVGEAFNEFGHNGFEGRIDLNHEVDFVPAQIVRDEAGNFVKIPAVKRIGTIDPISLKPYRSRRS